MPHTPMDERLRRVADATGAACTWRCISSHPAEKLVGMRVEVLDFNGDLCFVNPVTQMAERLSPNQVGGPIERNKEK